MPFCTDKILPKSFVTKVDAEKRRNYFLHTKYGPLNDNLGKPEVLCISYTENHFSALLRELLLFDAVRIYIASYSNEGGELVPPGFGNRLTLIYAPAMDTGTEFMDTQTYFIMNPGSPFQSISRDLASIWVKNYQDTKRAVLNSVIGLDDTVSILYVKPLLEGIQKEIECQPATGVRVYFASYTDTDTVKPNLQKRLIIQFTLTETSVGIEKDFFIDDRPGFDHRVEITKAARGNDVLDTGSPCPPLQCSGSSLPV